MKLQFPTMAERCANEFNSATKTISVATIAKRMKAVKEVEYVFGSGYRAVYYFDDDTRLIVTGRGKSHQLKTELP